MNLAPLFQDHAVLQRGLGIPVWGRSQPNERVIVTLAGKTARTLAAGDGRWLARLPALPAGGPHELVAEAPSGRAVARDILIGEVWVCSGQSNMEWKLSQINPPDAGPITAPLPGIRLLTVTNPARLGRQEAIDGQWKICTPSELADFSAVGGWFGRELHRELGVPIGLINVAWGGTRIQAWISRDALVQDPLVCEEVWCFEKAAYDPDPTAQEYTSFEDWERRGAPQDPGNEGLKKGWADPDFDDASWPVMILPDRWQAQGHPGSGILWFRKTVTLPPGWAQRDLELHLGAIDKHDDTWVNGKRVGGLSRDDGPTTWCTPRVYPVPAGLVGKDGVLSIAVRARSHVFNGGMIGPECEMRVVPAGESGATPVSLVGPWRYGVEKDWGMVTPPGGIWGIDTPNSPAILFDSRVTPLVPYALRGVIWYQGESNANEAQLYRRLMPLLIRDWRRAWGQGDFAFLQVQLANYDQPKSLPSPSAWAELREAQAAALGEPHSGMAVAIDLCDDPMEIHPRRKNEVGLRLARWALAEVYGRGGVPSGPLYAGVIAEGDGRMRIQFRHAAGLRTRDGAAPRHVAIAGADRAFVWAESRIEGENLLAWHPEIPCPVAVRYAWANNPEGCNLINAAGLPAAPFRTDGW